MQASFWLEEVLRFPLKGQTPLLRGSDSAAEGDPKDRALAQGAKEAQVTPERKAFRRVAAIGDVGGGWNSQKSVPGAEKAVRGTNQIRDDRVGWRPIGKK